MSKGSYQDGVSSLEQQVSQGRAVWWPRRSALL